MGKHEKKNDEADGITTGTNMGDITQDDVVIHDPEDNK